MACIFFFCKSHLPKALQANSSKPQDQELWHERLAHPSEVVLSKLFPMFCQPSLKCDTYHFSKFARLPFGSSMSKSSTPFEMVHTKVWGPTFESIEGYKYFVIFVDDYTRTTFLYLMKSKSEVPTIFKDFHKLVVTQFHLTIKTLRSDNGALSSYPIS